MSREGFRRRKADRQVHRQVQAFRARSESRKSAIKRGCSLPGTQAEQTNNWQIGSEYSWLNIGLWPPLKR